MAVRAVLSATEALASAQAAANAALAASASDTSSTTVLPSQGPAPLPGGELEVETEEDHHKRDNDLLNTPPPDYDKILFAPGDAYAFEGKAAHDNALKMLKEVLQTKEREAELAWLAKTTLNPKDPEQGAKLFSN